MKRPLMGLALAAGVVGAGFLTPALATTHTLTITATTTEDTTTCSVSDARLEIQPGDTVVFDIQTAIGQEVKFKHKGQQTLRFANGYPDVVDKGRSYDARGGSGGAGARWEYTIVVRERAFATLCVIDPVICIPKGITPGATAAAASIAGECN